VEEEATEEETRVLADLAKFPLAAKASAAKHRQAQDQEARVCTLISGQDILGDALGEGFPSEYPGEVSGDACRSRCEHVADCGCYVFDPSRNSTCWLKKSPCNELITHDQSGDMTSGICRNKRTQTCDSVVGKDIMADVLTDEDGNDVAFSPSDAETCRTRCEETPDCSCYAFDESRNSTCWLKTGACDHFYSWDETDDMTSGVCHEERPSYKWPLSSKTADGSAVAASATKKDAGASRQVCSTVTGMDIWKADALDDEADGEYPNTTASACRSRCESTPACRGYAFDVSRGNTCWLKKGPCDGKFYAWSETNDMVAGKCQEVRPLLDWPLHASSEEIGVLEQFRVVAGARANTIGLLSHHGTYVTAQPDGSVTVDGDSMGDWETFEEVHMPTGLVAFKSFHGGFLTASEAGAVSTSAAVAGDAEFFNITAVEDDIVAMQSKWGKYLTAVRLGAGANVVIRGDRDNMGSWATFILRPLPAEEASGETISVRALLLSKSWIDTRVSVQTYLGTYLHAKEDGSITANVQEEDIGECDIFVIVGAANGSMGLKTCKDKYVSVQKDGSVKADRDKVGPWESFGIETVNNQVPFSDKDVQVSATGNLTDVGEAPTEPQAVAFKTFFGQYFFPLEDAPRVDEMVIEEGDRLTQAVIYTGTCEESGMQPISHRQSCEDAARDIGMFDSDELEVEVVKEGETPEGCFVEERKHVRLGASTGSKGKGVVYTDNSTLNPICEGRCPNCAPRHPTAPALVILFYQRDLCKMRLLATSLTKHDPNQLISTVHLVWLSPHSPNDYMHDIDWIRNSASASHNVRFHDLSYAFGTPMPGWKIQQVVKLKAASLVQATGEDYFVVFDAKNAMIRDIRPDTFLTPCYQGKIFADTPWGGLPGEAKSWYQASARALGVGIDYGRRWSASITPVVMHTQTVIDMLHYIGESPSASSLCNGRLCGHINYGGATEFTLYYLFVSTKTDEKCIHASAAHNPAVSMWRGSAGQNEGACNNARDNKDVLMFGSQPGAISGIDGGQWGRIAGCMQEIFKEAQVNDPSGYSANGIAACVVG
jgi:hypothetical protein